MAASTISFAAPNYNASEPFPIESELVRGLGNPATSGMALPWLLAYQSERQQAGRQYADQLNEQHQLALDALRSNQANNAREQLVNIMKLTNPGAIEAATSNPLTAGLFAGADPNALKSMSDFNNRAAVAKILEQAGQGAQGALAGGIQLPPSAISGVTGLQAAAGTPPIVQAAQLNAASRVAAARASGGNATAPHYSFMVPPNTPGVPIGSTVTARGLPGETPEQAASRLGVGGRIPNLPMAPRDEGTQHSAAPTSAPAQQQAHQHITVQNLQQAKQSNPAAYNDIMQAAKATGGQVRVGPNGGLIGASGTEY